MRFVNGAWFQVDGDDGYVQGPISFERPVGSLPIVDDARWSADLTSNSWAALAVWLVLLVALQVAMWPVVRQIFSRFPDRGWAFGRLITLMTAGYAVWLLASVELIAFRAIWCVLAIVLLGVAVHIRSRKRSVIAPRPQDRPWRRNTSIVTAEVVFWAVFGLFLVFRLLNPDSYHPVWGGEKPMEFAHINAILRTAHFPPHDPWYADGILNYYYYGMYLVAFMMKVTGIPSEIAFNLAQPTMIAMLATGAFSVASALSFAWTRSTTLARIGGLTGVVLVSFSGNMVAAARLVLSIAETAPPFADFNYWFWTPTRVLPGQTTIHEFPYFTGAYADLHAHVVALPMTVLAIALCFAIVWNGRGLNLAVCRPRAFAGQTGAIALTFGLLALTLASLFVTNAWDIPTYAAVTVVSLLLATRTIRPMAVRLGVTVALAIGIGAIAAVMVWPFSQHYVALYGAVEGTRSVTPLVAIEAHFGVFFLIALCGLSFLMSRLWIAPPLFCRPIVFVAFITAVLFARWYVADRPAHWTELVDGLTVLVSVGWLFLGVILAARERLEFGIGARLARLLVVAAWLFVLGGLAVEKPAFAFFFGFGFAAGMLWLMLRPAAERFAAMLIAGGMFVGAGMELVYLVDGLSGGDYYRMNSVFKFYNGIWIMLALACAGFIAWMIHGLSESSRDLPKTSGERCTAATTPGSAETSGCDAVPTQDASESAEQSEDVLRAPDPETQPPLAVIGEEVADESNGFGMSRSWAQVGLVVAGVAILASLAYPVFATGARLGQHFAQPGGTWTLNALDWMNYGVISEHGAGGVVYAYDEDRDVIEWFNSEVPGSPVIAEASFGQYRLAGSRIAVHTGLPVVVGWLGHQGQQRAATDLSQRHEDVRTLYTSTDPEEKKSILRQYRIEYVVVGELERNYPTDGFHSTDNSAGIAAFEPLVGSVFEVAFVSGDTIVYRVIQG
ncbi:hypothetical protein BH20CHL3_BH20CHL3_11360 [soil metagenome]